MCSMTCWQSALLVLLLMLAAAGCGHDGATRAIEDKARLAAYANPNLLTSATWLQENLDSPDLIVIDARPAADYLEGHIPGALNVEWQALANTTGNPGEEDWGTVLPKSQLEQALGQLGLQPQSTVVVYAAPPRGWGEDGRIAWILHMVGIRGTRLLDGGLGAWRSAGGQLSKDAVLPSPQAYQIESIDSSYVADTQWISERIATVKIVDSRTPEEFDGAQLYGEARGGHLPGAILIPFTDVFDRDGKFRRQQDLQKLFEAAGLQQDDELVSYCTGGIRSAHLVLTLRLTGYTKARNYDQSFYRWAARSDLDVVK